MKTLILFLLISLILISCRKPGLYPISESSFTFKVNGKRFTPKDYVANGYFLNRLGVHGYYDLTIDQMLFSAADYSNENKNFPELLNISINASSAGNIIPRTIKNLHSGMTITMTKELGKLLNSGFYVSYAKANEFDNYKSEYGIPKGQLAITELDTVKKVFSGTFGFTLYNKDAILYK